jgi:hypothetical protein
MWLNIDCLKDLRRVLMSEQIEFLCVGLKIATQDVSQSGLLVEKNGYLSIRRAIILFQ